MVPQIAAIFLVSLYEGLIVVLGCPRRSPGCLLGSCRDRCRIKPEAS